MTIALICIACIFAYLFGLYHGFGGGYRAGYEASEFRHFWMGSGLDSDLHKASQEPVEDTRLDYTQPWHKEWRRHASEN